MRILGAVPTKFVLNIAQLGPLGRSRLAPGTLGSLAGVLWYLLGFWKVALFQFLLAYSLSVAVGALFCGEAEIRLNEKDPRSTILDEFCAMPLCYWHIERFTEQVAMWKILLYGFLLFRILDIVKPLGIRRLQKLHGGAGIMIDDIVAAFITCVLLQMTVPVLFL